uniref:Solute carrier family 12 member 3 n=1 Tax=Plectus sambesii TaxID=2011161 RepID=A0A914X1C2_9BILA
MADSIDSESNRSSDPDGFRVESVTEGDNSTGYQRRPDSVSSLSSVGRFQIASLKDNHESNAIHISVSSSNIQNQRKESFDTDEIRLADEKNMRNTLTIEKPPAIDFYLNLDKAEGCSSSRPSMITLVHGKSIDSIKLEITNSKGDRLGKQELSTNQVKNVEQRILSVARVKFGWLEGVFVRCILNILGVMLYLRISWVTGQAGIGLGSAIVLLASVVTTITTISLCAICTNGEVKGGGAYFVISRTLGPEFGGSIGLIFSMANTIGAAMYVVGFAETVRDLMKEKGWIIIDNGIMDVRIIGLITCTLLMAIVFIGTSFESRMQVILLFILIASIISYWTGTFLPVTEHQQLRGVTGYNFGTLTTNFLPAWRGEDFFSVFAVYFPAATGIMAGANISGDLANPQKAIPKGTLLAIAVTTALYLLTIWQTGATCVRDADGLSPPLFSNESSLKWIQPDCVYNATCEYGLMNYFQVMEIESGWGPLITAGIFAATLSSALASLVSAPKVFQAVCKDHLFPYIHYFSKGYGKDDEPRRAYCLGYIIAMLMILLGTVVATEAHNVSVLNNMADNPHKLVHQSSKMARDESGLTPNHEDTTDESRALTGTQSNRVVIVDDKNNRLTDKKAEKTKKAGGTAAQMNMHGVFLHILGDAFGSLIVIISAGVCYFFKEKEYLQLYLDPSLSLIMVCVIVTTTVPLLKETALILLQTTPKYMNVQTMKAKLLKFDGVLAIHEFHVWRLAGQKIIATAHIRFRSLTDYLQAAEKIKNFFHEQEIHSTTIQPEFAEMIPAESNHELTSDGHCFLSCPPEQCDTSATCCGPVDSSATKTPAGSLSPRTKTETAPPPPSEDSAKSTG